MSVSQVTASPWQEIELEFTLRVDVANPYTDVEAWVDFTHSDGQLIRRPAFWDGGAHWRCRFTSPLASGQWQWQAHAAVEEHQLDPRSGAFSVGPTVGPARGLLGLAPGGPDVGLGRRLAAGGGGGHRVGDALAGRRGRRRAVRRGSAPEGVQRGSADDRPAGHGRLGPTRPEFDLGFEVGFEDLPDGHLNELNVEYFHYVDQILAVLFRYDLIPILQPVFHGFGWKGLGVAGPVVPPAEYARYCRYLVARYGARPVIYLVGADGAGTERQIEAGAVRCTPGTRTASPPGSTIGPMPAGTRTNRPIGWTSSGVRPATKAITYRTGSPTY